MVVVTIWLNEPYFEERMVFMVVEEKSQEEEMEQKENAIRKYESC